MGRVQLQHGAAQGGGGRQHQGRGLPGQADRGEAADRLVEPVEGVVGGDLLLVLAGGDVRDGEVGGAHSQARIGGEAAADRGRELDDAEVDHGLRRAEVGGLLGGGVGGGGAR